LARQLSLDLLAAWGADRGDLDGAVDVVDALAASGPLAPTPAPAPGS